MKSRVLVCLILLFAFFFELNAQCVYLNPSFGDEGIITTNFNWILDYDDYSTCSVLDENGNLILGGHTKVNSDLESVALAFYNDDGSLNADINGNGKIVNTISFECDYVSELLIQPDGKIVVGGYLKYFSNDNFLFLRFLPDGNRDVGFGNSGLLTQFFPNSSLSRVRSFELLPNGEFVAFASIDPVFTTRTKDIAMLRVLSDGTYDSSFDDDGKKTITFGITPSLAGDEYPTCSGQHGNGILVGGYNNNSNGREAFIGKVDIDGNVVPAFGFNGIYTFKPQGYDCAFTELTVLDDQRVFACGLATENGKENPFVVMLNDLGKLDPSFAGNGSIILNTINGGRAVDFTETEDAYFVLANTFSQWNILLYKILKNGTLDPQFGENGMIELEIDGVQVGSGIHVLADGDLAVTGTSNDDFSIFKVNPCLSVSSKYLDERNHISMYPNPVDEVLYIENQEDWENILSITIYSAKGQEMKRFPESSIQAIQKVISIPVARLSPGAYFVSIEMHNKKRTQKFIKE